jgi:hypothetical protein
MGTLTSVVQRQGSPAGGGSTEPVPALPDLEARRALALHIIKKAYGGLIKQESEVIGAKSDEQLRKVYDRMEIALKLTFPEKIPGTNKNRKWEMGDSAKHPKMSKELRGFHHPTTGKVHIDLSRKPDEQVVTIAHEMLHTNAAGDFLPTLGDRINEGMTERLTQKALAKSGYSGSSDVYGRQMELVGKLCSMFGDNTMMYAYFRGTAILRSMMEATLDKSVFDKFASDARANNKFFLDQFFRDYKKAKEGAEVDKKIAAISALLDWWVTDDHISSIENILSGCSREEKAQIRDAIWPRTSSLTSYEQRFRLRTALSS